MRDVNCLYEIMSLVNFYARLKMNTGFFKESIL